MVLKLHPVYAKHQQIKKKKKAASQGKCLNETRATLAVTDH